MKIKDEKISIAKEMKKEGFTIETIMRITKLYEEDVEKLR